VGSSGFQWVPVGLKITQWGPVEADSDSVRVSESGRYRECDSACERDPQKHTDLAKGSTRE